MGEDAGAGVEFGGEISGWSPSSPLFLILGERRWEYIGPDFRRER